MLLLLENANVQRHLRVPLYNLDSLNTFLNAATRDAYSPVKLRAFLISSLLEMHLAPVLSSSATRARGSCISVLVKLWN